MPAQKRRETEIGTPLNEFWSWWRHLPGAIDPVLITIGPVKIHYYGVMYLVAFAVSYWLVLYRIRTERRFRFSTEDIQEVTFWMILGVIAGGRLGYVIFYNLPYYLKNPLEIILPFRFDGGMTFTGLAGMSYHGGLLGILLAAWLYSRRHGKSFFALADLFAPAVPLGYTFGRIGNFINGELYGRRTSVPWGMYFPAAPDRHPRHPSQLYEAFFEGVALFAVLWILRRKRLPQGGMLAFYLIGYGLARFVIEFFRRPDPHIGLEVLALTRGQLLSMLMILGGMILFGHLHLADHHAGSGAPKSPP